MNINPLVKVFRKKRDKPQTDFHFYVYSFIGRNICLLVQRKICSESVVVLLISLRPT
jgi:hypothetical protein